MDRQAHRLLTSMSFRSDRICLLEIVDSLCIDDTGRQAVPFVDCSLTARMHDF